MESELESTCTSFGDQLNGSHEISTYHVYLIIDFQTNEIIAKKGGPFQLNSKFLSFVNSV